jgi:hypothetical protein
MGGGCEAHFSVLQVSDMQKYTGFLFRKIFLQAFYAT